MAENKTKATGASVPAYVESLDAARRPDVKSLIKLMRGVTGDPAKMWGPAIVGFGQYHYVYDSGREGDMPLAAFSPRKSAMVIYITTKFPGAGALLAKLGKHKLSGGCLHIKTLADVDEKVLGTIVAKSYAATKARHA